MVIRRGNPKLSKALDNTAPAEANPAEASLAAMNSDTWQAAVAFSTTDLSQLTEGQAPKPKSERQGFQNGPQELRIEP